MKYFRALPFEKLYSFTHSLQFVPFLSHVFVFLTSVLKYLQIKAGTDLFFKVLLNSSGI